MQLENVFSGKTALTDTALERLLTRVNAGVNLKASLVGKGLGTLCAGKRFYPRVDQEMSLQPVPPNEPLATLLTLERFFFSMGPRVQFKAVLAIEGATADAARKWALARVRA